ncbi:SAS-like protein [Mya arenaria]|uniref:SAS-like protein n=1 Tax=Mya arenaria TaxID=6604 RepID=A0ABY7ER75_MYAAR|nr:SAS-like protein [Mya arenaria]
MWWFSPSQEAFLLPQLRLTSLEESVIVSTKVTATSKQRHGKMAASTTVCAKFPPLPAACHMIPDPSNACCQIPKCDFTGVVTSMTNAVTQPSFTNPPQPTQAPQIFTTSAPKMCIYKGMQYSEGQQWFDGCDFKCTCVNAMVGYHQCSPRCPQFFNVPAGCTEVPDPNDPACCKVPQCIPTPPPGFCTYKGRQYQGGATWDDGCDYTCLCEDASSGRYSCTDRCPSYGALPPQCKMVPDFTNPCCQKPTCDFSGSFTDITGTLTPVPNPGGPTLVPNPNPNPCHMITDPNDSCCRMPTCDFTPTSGGINGSGPTLAPNPNPTMVPTKVPGVIIGHANTPAPTPGPDGSTQAPMPLNARSTRAFRPSVT